MRDRNGSGATAPRVDAATERVLGALRFLSDRNRLRVLACLAERPAYGSELTDRLVLPQSLVAYHLRQLRAAGLVHSERHGHRVYYAIDPAAWSAFAQPIKDLCDLVDVISDESAARERHTTAEPTARTSPLTSS